MFEIVLNRHEAKFLYLGNSIIKAAKLRYRSYKIYKVMVSNAAGRSRMEGKYIILSYYTSQECNSGN